MTEPTVKHKTDINELFSRDPLELTNEDIDEIIAHMRERRVLFNSTPVTKAGAPKKLTAAQSKVQGLNVDFEL